MSEASGRKGKRAGRRSRGLQLADRDGFWHVHGTVRAAGRSIRVRRSLGLPADAHHQEEAEALLDVLREDVKAEATGQQRKGDAVAVAARAYLNADRVRPLAPSAIRIVQEIVRQVWRPAAQRDPARATGRRGWMRGRPATSRR